MTQDERGTLEQDDPLWQAVQDGHVTWLHSTHTQGKDDVLEGPQEGPPMGDECLIDCDTL